MNPVKYSPYIPSDNNTELGKCGVCWEDLSVTDQLVAHEDEGQRHPIHQECIKEIVKNTFVNCPYCMKKIDTSSVLSEEERKVLEERSVLEGSNRALPVVNEERRIVANRALPVVNNVNEREMISVFMYGLVTMYTAIGMSAIRDQGIKGLAARIAGVGIMTIGIGGGGTLGTMIGGLGGVFGMALATELIDKVIKQESMPRIHAIVQNVISSFALVGITMAGSSVGHQLGEMVGKRAISTLLSSGIL